MIMIRKVLACVAILTTLVAVIAVCAFYLQSPGQVQPVIGGETSEDSMPENVSQEPASQVNGTSQESSNMTHET
ncbi:MAG: hypothetical protein QXQ41_00880, partial [Candidatus Bathyarchaeia archaeon]